MDSLFLDIQQLLMKKYFTLLILIQTLVANAQIIPAAQRVDWSNAGFEGTIPSPTTIIDVTTLGAIANDTVDDYLAVTNAIAYLNGHAGVVFFPSGNYVLSSAINVPDSVVIRGNGATQTHLNFNFNNTANNCFNISQGQSSTFTPIVSGYSKDAKKIIVTNASQNFNGGDAIEIRQANGAWDTNPAVWATYAVGHVSTIDSVSADSIYLHEALRINFDAALNPEIRKIIPRIHCGLECFSLTRTDSVAASVNYGVYFSYANNCWVSGVECSKTICAQIFAEVSNHLTIAGNYFHDSYLYDGVSTHGYGVALAVHTGACLVENNIFKHLRHAMMVKQGANGNVFAYNYSREPNRSETISDFPGDISSHGHYPFANLFEGNIVQNIMIDQAWGPSGPYNTFFRNRAELYGFIMSSGTMQSDSQNVVGNDITNNALFMGNYIFYGNGNFEHGNNVKGIIMPGGTQTLADSSYYLTAPPTYWNMANSFPNMGTPNTPGASNPAFDRYNSGNFTNCNNGVFTALHSQFSNLQLAIGNVKVSENEIEFKLYNAVTGNYQFTLMDRLGKIVLQKQFNVFDNNQHIKIDLNQIIGEGIYVGSVSNSSKRVSFKCFK